MTPNPSWIPFIVCFVLCRLTRVDLLLLLSTCRSLVHLVSSLDEVFFERARACVPDKLDLSLCTVGTSSAFLQTADNICLSTCTVTCRTLLTLQMMPRPIPPAVPCPAPPSSGLSRDLFPSPQAAGSWCKWKLHFILCRLDWPDSVFLLFLIGVALNVFYFPFYVI